MHTTIIGQWIFLVLFAIFGTVHSYCVYPWLLLDRNATHCYLVESTPMNYAEAHRRCSKRGGELMEPRSRDQTRMISRLMRQSDTHYWIGLTDFVQEGTFRWSSDDSLANYTNWYKSEPNNQQPDGEDCVITSGMHVRNKWNDQSCSRRMGAYGREEFRPITAACQKRRPWEIVSLCPWVADSPRRWRHIIGTKYISTYI